MNFKTISIGSLTPDTTVNNHNIEFKNEGQNNFKLNHVLNKGDSISMG
jgi:hypothetical protein